MQIGTSTSGTSAFDAMRAAFGSKNMDEMDSKLATGIMSAKDTDKSGTLSAAELGVSQSNVAEFDTDGDGQVSQAELEAGLKAQREQMQNQLLQTASWACSRPAWARARRAWTCPRWTPRWPRTSSRRRTRTRAGG